MKLTFIGHACFRVESDAGLRILVDPYLPGAFGGKMGLKPYLEPVDIVVSTHEHADALDHPAVHVEAIGGARGVGGWTNRPDYPAMASVDAAAEMWARTDLGPGDVDTAQLYDGFTFLTFAGLEALGLVGEGEAGPFVEGATRIALDGELPLNTYGGQLSAGRMHGYWILHEACAQLRGEAGERQIARPPEVAVVANGGGPIAGCMLLTR